MYLWSFVNLTLKHEISSMWQKCFIEILLNICQQYSESFFTYKSPWQRKKKKTCRKCMFKRFLEIEYPEIVLTVEMRKICMSAWMDVWFVWYVMVGSRHGEDKELVVDEWSLPGKAKWNRISWMQGSSSNPHERDH